MRIHLEGTIRDILPEKEGVSNNGYEWSSQSYVLQEEDGTLVEFKIFGKAKIERTALKVGDVVVVSCSLESKAWTEKDRYTTQIVMLRCYKLPDTRAFKQAERAKSNFDNLPY